MLVVVQADQLIPLLVDGLDGLLGTQQERIHLGVLIRVVGHEVGATDLPRAKELLGVIIGTAEPVF